MGGMGLISVPNSCSIRYLQDMICASVMTRWCTGGKLTYIDSGADPQLFAAMLKQLHTYSVSDKVANQRDVKTGVHWESRRLQVEPVLVGDQVHCQTQMPKPARSAHLCQLKTVSKGRPQHWMPHNMNSMNSVGAIIQVHLCRGTRPQYMYRTP